MDHSTGTPTARTPDALADAACAAAGVLATRHRSVVLPWDAVVLAAARRAGGAVDVGAAAVQHARAAGRLAQLGEDGASSTLVGPPDVLESEELLTEDLAERSSVVVDRVVGGAARSSTTLLDDVHALDAVGLLGALAAATGEGAVVLRGAGGVLGHDRVDLLGALLDGGVQRRDVLPTAAALARSRLAELAVEVDRGDVRALPPVDRDVFVGAELDRSRLVARVVRAVTVGAMRRLDVAPAGCEVLTPAPEGPVGAAVLRLALQDAPGVRVSTITTAPPEPRGVVVIVLDRSHEALLDRSVLATAVARASTALILLGDPDVLRRAVRRTPPRRWSTIAARLQEMG